MIPISYLYDLYYKVNSTTVLHIFFIDVNFKTGKEMKL